MRITDNKPISELQKEFTKEFPFLKIEFYRYPHDKGKGSPGSEQLSPDLLLGQVQNFHNSGYLKLDGNLTVGALEQTFQNIFGLNVQVFRRSFGKWIQSWVSDSWTLKEQNLRGMLTDEPVTII